MREDISLRVIRSFADFEAKRVLTGLGASQDGDAALHLLM